MREASAFHHNHFWLQICSLIRVIYIFLKGFSCSLCPQKDVKYNIRLLIRQNIIHSRFSCYSFDMRSRPTAFKKISQLVVCSPTTLSLSSDFLVFIARSHLFVNARGILI